MEILQRAYTSITRLDHWLVQVDSQHHFTGQLLQLNDSTSYRELLQSVYVCSKEDTPVFTWISLSQHQSMRELIMYSIQHLLRKRDRGGPGNILILGYYSASVGSSASLCGVNVENRYPNSLVNRLHYKVWQTLLGRIGDDAMRYLLENASLYLSLEAGCFVQLTGDPLFNLSFDESTCQKLQPSKSDGKAAELTKAAKLAKATQRSKAIMYNAGKHLKKKRKILHAKRIRGKTDRKRSQDEPAPRNWDTTNLDIANGDKNECILSSEPVLEKNDKGVLEPTTSTCNNSKKNLGPKSDKCIPVATPSNGNNSNTNIQNLANEKQSQQQLLANTDLGISDHTGEQPAEKTGKQLNELNVMCKVKKARQAGEHLAENTEIQINAVSKAKKPRKRKYEKIDDARFDNLIAMSKAYAAGRVGGETCEKPIATSKEFAASRLGQPVSSNIPAVHKTEISEIFEATRVYQPGSSSYPVSVVHQTCAKEGASSIATVLKGETNEQGDSHSVTPAQTPVEDKCAGEMDVGHKGGALVKSGTRQVSQNADTVTLAPTPVEDIHAGEIDRHMCVGEDESHKGGAVVVIGKRKLSQIEDTVTPTQKPGEDMCIGEMERHKGGAVVIIGKRKFSQIEDTVTPTQKPGEDMCIGEMESHKDAAVVIIGKRKLSQIADTVTPTQKPGEDMCIGEEERHKGVATGGITKGKRKFSQIADIADNNDLVSEGTDTNYTSVVTKRRKTENPEDAETRTYPLATVNSNEEVNSDLAAKLEKAGEDVIDTGRKLAEDKVDHKLRNEKGLAAKVEKDVIDTGRKLEEDTVDNKLRNEKGLAAKVEKDVIDTGRKLEEDTVDNKLRNEKGLAAKVEKDVIDTGRKLEEDTVDNKLRNEKGLAAKVESSGEDVADTTNAEPATDGSVSTHGTLADSKADSISKQEPATLLKCSLCKPFCGSEVICRKKLLFVRNIREQVPKSAVLSKLDTSEARLDRLYCQMFDDAFRTTTQGSATSNEVSSGTGLAPQHSEQKAEVKQAVLPLLEEFILKHKSCKRRVWLAKHCPVLKSSPAHRGKARSYASGKPWLMTQLLNNHHHHRKVFLFIRACVVRTIPQPLIGGPRNMKILLKTISGVISMGRFDKFSIGQAMKGMKTQCIPWLTSLPCNQCKVQLLSRLVHWLLVHYVFVLLRVHFYVTDSTFLRYQLLYYRQPTWTRLHMLAVAGLLNRKITKPISERVVREKVVSKDSLGVSTLRFLPKQKSLRPIINMAVQTSVQNNQIKLPVNKQLLDVHRVLAYIKTRNPSIIGHGKLGVNEIHSAWRDFVARWRGLNQPRLYFVKTDIMNCYDTIIQRKLYEIMERILKQELEDECIVRKYFTVRATDRRIQKQFHRHVTDLSDFRQDFVSFCKELVSSKHLHDTILVDKVLYQHETCDSVLKTLRAHLFNNIIKIGQQYYIQAAGISQGSVLSNLLCGVYYADMERHHVAMGDEKRHHVAMGDEEQHGVAMGDEERHVAMANGEQHCVAMGEQLIRIVDDYMYVTPYLDRATTFLDTMLEGIEEYNCHTNMEKVVTNFPYTTKSGHSLEPLNTDWFPWCGMLFNTRTLDTAMDYTRYSGTNIKDTVTFDFVKQMGQTMKQKLIYCVRQKCQPVLVDVRINSETQVYENIYHVFLFCMYKWQACAKHTGQWFDNSPRFFIGLFTEMSKTARKIIHKSQGKDSSSASVSYNQILWLCYKAYLVKFRRQSCMQAMKKLVKRKLLLLNTCMSDKIMQHIDDLGLPEDFCNMFA